MSTQEEFLNALSEDEDDTLTRMVYADWLDECGQHEEADRQRKWPAAKEWLVRFCEDFGGVDESDFHPDNPYAYFDISYGVLLMLAREALQSANQGERFLYLDCGANEPMCHSLRVNHTIFWPIVSILTGVPLPADFESRSQFGCSC